MKKIIISALLVLALAFTAAAATVTFDVIDGDVTGTYQVVAVVDDDEGDFRSYANTLTFDSNVIVPVAKTTGNVANIAGGTVKSPVKAYSCTYFDEDEEDYLNFEATVQTVSWTAGENGLYTLVYESLTTKPNNYPLDGMQVFSMHFKYADGKSEADLTSDSFKVDAITYADGGYNYYGRDDEGKATNITVVNNVVPAPVVEETYWDAGNGYNLVDMDGNVVANNSPVTKTEKSATEVTVKYGGYYQGADNWAGAALKEAVTIDGLEVEVTYTTLPTSDDCWAYIGVLANPSIFSTNAPYNNGYVNLIRYSEGNMSVHGTTKWEKDGTYGDGFFALKNGDVLRVCFDKNEEGTYDITYVKNNADVFKLPVAIDLETALDGTTGCVVASASCLGSEANAFEYTVDVAPEELAVAKIPVAAGDTVYEYTADGSSYTATEITADGTYNVIAPASATGVLVVVNSGYTSQKVYSVHSSFDGYYREATQAANGVLGDDEVSVRVVDPQGIRFFGTVANAIAEDELFEEYGFIMTAESAYNNLGTDYALDMALVKAGKAKKGVAHDDNGTDKYFSRDDEATVIAGVLYGIPKTAAGVQTVIASRPYYVVDGQVVYGEVTKATLYDIAKAIYNVEGYEVAWEYAKEVIELAKGDIDTPVLPELNSEIAIDVSELYK